MNPSSSAPLCSYSKKLAQYQVGVAHYNKRQVEQMIGFVAMDHVEEAITDIMKQAFGTQLWPTVHDLEGKLLYHSYDAELQKQSAIGGWQSYILSLEQ